LIFFVKIAEMNGDTVGRITAGALDLSVRSIGERQKEKGPESMLINPRPLLCIDNITVAS
jgi:hypothetical protein